MYSTHLHGFNTIFVFSKHSHGSKLYDLGISLDDYVKYHYKNHSIPERYFQLIWEMVTVKTSLPKHLHNF